MAITYLWNATEQSELLSLYLEISFGLMVLLIISLLLLGTAGVIGCMHVYVCVFKELSAPCVITSDTLLRTVLF